MKIKEVSYGVTQLTGDYENIKFGVVITETNGKETFEELLQEAKNKVHETVSDLLAEKHKQEKLYLESSRLETKINSLNRSLESASSKWEKAKKDYANLQEFVKLQGFQGN